MQIFSENSGCPKSPNRKEQLDDASATRCNKVQQDEHIIETSSVFAQRNRLAGQWTILIHMHETQALQNHAKPFI